MTPKRYRPTATDRSRAGRLGQIRQTGLIRRSAKNQRGAAAIMVGVMMLTFVTAIGATLDIARGYYAQRELQKLANLAAIDAAQAIGGCRGDFSGATAQDAANTAVANSLAANARPLVLGSTPSPTVTVGTVGSDGTFRFVDPDPVDAPDDPRYIAAQVNLTAQSPSRLLNVLGNDPVTLTASGAASNSPQVTFVVRSRLFKLDPGTSSSPAVQNLSNALFGDSGFIDLLNSEDVADVDLTLLDIVSADVEVSGDGLLQVDDLNVGGLEGLLDGIETALGDVNPTAASVVDQIADILQASGLLDGPTMPGDIFGVDDGQEVVAGLVPLNVSDILDAVSAASLGSDPITIPVSGGLPAGLVSVNTTVQILDPPKMEIGRAGITARAAQVQLNAEIDVNLANVLPLLPPLVNGNIDLQLSSASAEGTVESIECAMAGNDGIHTVEVSSQTSAATLSPNVDLSLLGLPLAGVSADPIDIATGSDAGNFNFSGPQRAGVPEPYIGESVIWPEDLQLGAGLSNALSDLEDRVEVSVLGLPLPLGGLGSVLSGLGTIFTAIDGLLDPLADILGLTVASGEYEVSAIQINPDGRPPVDMLIH